MTILPQGWKNHSHTSSEANVNERLSWCSPDVKSEIKIVSGSHSSQMEHKLYNQVDLPYLLAEVRDTVELFTEL